MRVITSHKSRPSKLFLISTTFCLYSAERGATRRSVSDSIRLALTKSTRHSCLKGREGSSLSGFPPSSKDSGLRVEKRKSILQIDRARQYLPLRLFLIVLIFKPPSRQRDTNSRLSSYGHILCLKTVSFHICNSEEKRSRLMSGWMIKYPQRDSISFVICSTRNNHKMAPRKKLYLFYTLHYRYRPVIPRPH